MVMPFFAKDEVTMAKMGYFECLSTIFFVIVHFTKEVGPKCEI
jgi:hypothetical protein